LNRFLLSLLDAPRGISGAQGVAVSQHYKASQTGAEIIAAGGTAMDAAVAMAFVIGIVEPWMSGLGGTGYMLVGRYGETPEVIDFSTRSPLDLPVEKYMVVGGKDDMHPWPRVEDDFNTKGALAICAPTITPGLELGWLRHGRMPWADLVKPARQIAMLGQTIDWYTQLIIASAASDLQSDPDAANLFLEPDGTGRATGWTSLISKEIKHHKLADSLELIAIKGAKTLQNGDLAHAIVSDIRHKGGVLKIEDFTATKPSVQKPIHIKFKNESQLWTVPGLSGGPTIAALLSAWEKHGSPDIDNPLPSVLSARSVLHDRFLHLGDGYEDATAPSCTTSYCVIDCSGLIVAATLTLVSIFGSKVISPSTGILINNAISWFDPVAGKPNSLAAGKKPLTNMAPCFIQTNDGNLTALSAAGGRRIVPALAQVAAYNLLSGNKMESALAKPRLDLRGDGTITADARFPKASLEQLRSKVNVDLALPTVFPYHFAIVNAAEYSKSGKITGFCEPMCPNAVTTTVS